MDDQQTALAAIIGKKTDKAEVKAIKQKESNTIIHGIKETTKNNNKERFLLVLQATDPHLKPQMLLRSDD